jgi:hypothetical protein
VLDPQARSSVVYRTVCATYSPPAEADRAGRNLLILQPSAAKRMIFARTASKYGAVYFPANAVSSFCSSSGNRIVYGLRLGIRLFRAIRRVNTRDLVAHYQLMHW